MSLKRLLNDSSDNDDDETYHRQATRRDRVTDSSQTTFLQPGPFEHGDNISDFFSSMWKDDGATSSISFSTPELDYGNEQIICYGMISHVAVKLLGDMLELDAKIRSNKVIEATDMQRLAVNDTQTEGMFIDFLDGTHLGTLNQLITKALRSIAGNSHLQFDVIAQTSNLTRPIARAKKASDAVVRVNINVYGPMSISGVIGTRLSEAKVYLQRPITIRPSYNYKNPHLIEFPGFQPTKIEEHNMAIKSNSANSALDPEFFQQAVSHIYSSLKRHEKLDQLQVDHILKTTLLIHQRKALNFMVQREAGTSPIEFRLWRPVEREGQTLYIHDITKAKSRVKPEEMGGGILADDMGMGKSLSILALIVKTMDHGRQWESQMESAERKVGIATHSRATLVIVPSALLINNWMNEIEIHLDGTLNVIKYHGQGRVRSPLAFKDAHVVLTTYNTLGFEYVRKSSPLHEVDWYRVVLDEGHIIRRQATDFYRTVADLSARSRWCLTGTPIQNRLEDIGSLFAFIRADPFHSLANFRYYVVNPFHESEEKREIASDRLARLIDSLCLRRSKRLLGLKGWQDHVRKITFSQREREQYEITKESMNRDIREQAGEYHGNTTFGMFQAKLQLRILCNHGTYQQHCKWMGSENRLEELEDDFSRAIGGREIDCSSCKQTMPMFGSSAMLRRHLKGCSHVICSECMEHFNEKGNNLRWGPKGRVPQCPLCMTAGTIMTRAAEDGEDRCEDDYFSTDGYSSKMTALVADVKTDLWTTKSMIFSCWTRTLNLIARHLDREAIPFQRIDGDSILSRRQQILDDFGRSPKTPLLIMTTGTGAFGLNLTAANRVFIVEPQWNPSIESQAIARAVRLGQREQVLVTRYFVEGTVEQELRSQQLYKLKLAEIGFEQESE